MKLIVRVFGLVKRFQSVLHLAAECRCVPAEYPIERYFVGIAEAMSLIQRWIRRSRFVLIIGRASNSRLSGEVSLSAAYDVACEAQPIGHPFLAPGREEIRNGGKYIFFAHGRLPLIPSHVLA